MPTHASAGESRPEERSLSMNTYILAIINHQDVVFLFSGGIFVHNAPVPFRPPDRKETPPSPGER